MASWPHKAGKFWPMALVALGAAYPVAVFLGQGRVGLWVPILLAALLLLARLCAVPSDAARAWRGLTAAAFILLLALALYNSGLAAKAYPVLVSAMLAAVFGLSLLRPPSVIERLAMLSEPDLPPAGRRYCRRVTVMWLGWLVFNALLSAALALWGSVEAWTLWCSVLSYLAMGALFLGEYAVRRHQRRRWAVS